MSEIAQPYEMHRTLMRAFPQASDDDKHRARDEFGVLFRAETEGPGGVVKVFVQSRIEPDWRFLEGLDDYLYPESGSPGYEYKDIMPSYNKLTVGQMLSFRLRANPTKRIAQDDHPMKGKRVELMHEEEQVAWLIRKGQEREKGVSGGFELLMKTIRDESGGGHLVPRVTISKEGKLKGRKKEPGAGHITTHLAVLYEGLLRVTDANAFRETIIYGIGSAKAFGFGLLSVAPARGAL
jgi:CRISPR system Cascade subunit CasE